jgi:hypothetical protein
VLSHLLPATDPKDEYERLGEQVNKPFSGKVLVAKDLMEILTRFSELPPSDPSQSAEKTTSIFNANEAIRDDRSRSGSAVNCIRRARAIGDKVPSAPNGPPPLRATVTSAGVARQIGVKRSCSNAGCVLSVDSEAVNPARASGVVERLLAAPLAHMRCIPRRVLATCPVHVTKHGTRAVRRNVRVLLR